LFRFNALSFTLWEWNAICKYLRAPPKRGDCVYKSNIYIYLLPLVCTTQWCSPCSVGHSIPHLTWNLKFDYHIHKNLPLDSILSHFNPIHTLLPISVISSLIISSHLCLGLHFRFSEQNVICISHLPDVCNMFCPSHLI
jgi:hypothetical protein